MKNTYSKPPLSYGEQIALLQRRGLTVPNEERAITYLHGISYYRLSAYFLPYQSQKDTFDTGTTFDQIIHTYTFDRALRLLIFDCIERIEIAIRTQIIYCMAKHHNDAHWQDKSHHFIPAYTDRFDRLTDHYAELQAIIDKAKTTRKPEVFIRHYLDNYSSPSNPPSWMCLELLTIGELSNLYRGLSDKDDQKRIAKFFDLYPPVFISWLHSLTYVRNICAHHSRLWNRDLSIEPEKLRKPVGPWVSERFDNNKRVFYFICILKYLLDRANPGNHLKEKLETLFQKHPDVPIKFMGIPSDDQGNLMPWNDEPIFRG